MKYLPFFQIPRGLQAIFHPNQTWGILIDNLSALHSLKTFNWKNKKTLI
jgi:hypothetical protein